MPDHHEDLSEEHSKRDEIRHRRAESRQRIIERLDDENRPDLAKRLKKCGEKLELLCTECGRPRVVFIRCDNKWCPACAPLIAHKNVERLLPVAKLMLSPIFVTWTVKNWTDRVGLRELRRAFAKLIKLRWFKRCVRGGVASFEVSRMSKVERRAARLGKREGKGWHPHAHALMDCRWLSLTVSRPPPGTTAENFRKRARAALEEVAAQWSLALGRPGSVKVRATFHTDNGDPEPGLRETLKYSVSPDVLEKSPEPIAELIDELILTRNLTTFGDFYRHPLLKKQPRESTPCECGACKSLMPATLVEKWVRFGESDTAKLRRAHGLRKTPCFRPEPET